jgi:hypothetical protein
MEASVVGVGRSIESGCGSGGGERHGRLLYVSSSTGVSVAKLIALYDRTTLRLLLFRL